jgi:HlyD family type I secretion membrane fusion protein
MGPIDADFLPDANALVERRSSPLAGALIASIAVLMAATFAWLAWAEVEEVVRAQGRIEPAGRVKLVNHPQGGRVSIVHVRDGQRVEAGAPLITFDPAVGEGEHAELLGRWQARAAETARLEAEAAGRTILFLDPEIAGARPDLVEAQTRLLEARAAAQATRHEGLTRAVQTRRGELRTAMAEEQRLKNSLTLFRQQLDAVKELADRGLYPRLRLVAVEREVGDTQGELKKAEANIAAAQAALAESQSRLDGLDRESYSEVLGDLARSTAERDRLREQLRGQETRLGNMVVRAPVAGYVDSLMLTGPGQAVGPNDMLMKLVPADEGLQIEARVANEDIGRVREGMPAVVKVRAYDYLRYGSLDGTVRKIAADASPERDTGALRYTVTVVTDRQRLGAAPGSQELAPGMVVDVELEVGARTILSYLTDRLIKLHDGAFKEG